MSYVLAYLLASPIAALLWWCYVTIRDRVTAGVQYSEDPSHPGAYAPPARRLAGDPDQSRAARPHRWGARPRARCLGPRTRRAR